jgi:hypothetical protein
MSDLQLGLLGIGVLVVAGVYAYNKWQESKLEKKTRPAPERGAAAPAGDAAQSDDVRTASRAAPPPRRKEAAATQDRVEHVAGGSAVDPALRSAPPTILVEGVDYAIGIETAEPVTGAQVRAAMESHLQGLAHPVHWDGLDLDLDAWTGGSDRGRYELVRMGLQLCNRGGPATTAEIATFAAAVEEIAASLGGVAEGPDAKRAAADAAALDQFCADVDVQIGFNLMKRDGGTFPGTKIRTLAEAAGCSLDADGVYRRRDEEGAELFALTNLDGGRFRADGMRELASRGLAVTLDVPRSPGGPNAFRRFLDFARQIAQTLDGVLVDDNRRPLSDVAFAQIGSQLEGVHRTMAERGVTPGGRLALRLFS